MGENTPFAKQSKKKEQDKGHDTKKECRDSGNDFSFPFRFPKLNDNNEKLFLFGYPNYNSRFFSFPFLS